MKSEREGEKYGKRKGGGGGGGGGIVAVAVISKGLGFI